MKKMLSLAFSLTENGDLFHRALPVIVVVSRLQIRCRGGLIGKISGRNFRTARCCGCRHPPPCGVFKCYACKPGAILERKIPDARHTCGDRDACKSTAPVELIRADARQLDTLGKCYACKSGAFVERRRADACHACGNRDARESIAMGERRRADALHPSRNFNACERATIEKCRIADVLHACGNRDARESIAIGERIRADARQLASLGKYYACERVTIVERIVANHFRSVKNFKRCYVCIYRGQIQVWIFAIPKIFCVCICRVI